MNSFDALARDYLAANLRTIPQELETLLEPVAGEIEAGGEPHESEIADAVRQLDELQWLLKELKR
jgi:hypothetical protein